MKHWFSDVQPFRHDPLQFLLNRVENNPAPLERMRLGPTPCYLVTDPATAKEVLSADEALVDKGRLVQKLRPLIGDSFLTISGPEQQKRREIVHRELITAIGRRVPAMAAVIRRFAAELANEKTFDPHELTGPLALNLICVALFGEDVLTSGDRQAIFGAMKVIEADLGDTMFRTMPLSPWAYLRRQKQREMALSHMSFVVNRVRRNAAASSLVRSLEALELPDDGIRNELLTMLLAGHHTTGTAAAWILYHLATEPELASEISEEAGRVSDSDGEIQPREMMKATRSLALVREILRLYPSAWWFSREVKTPTTIAGKALSRGTSLIISPWQMNRDARYWDKPHAFVVDRSFNNPAYLPFGAGPRKCVGMGLAMTELQLLTLELAAAFRLKLISPFPAPWPSAGLTLIPPAMTAEIIVRDNRAKASVAA